MGRCEAQIGEAWGGGVRGGKCLPAACRGDEPSFHYGPWGWRDTHQHRDTPPPPIYTLYPRSLLSLLQKLNKITQQRGPRFDVGWPGGEAQFSQARGPTLV